MKYLLGVITGQAGEYARRQVDAYKFGGIGLASDLGIYVQIDGEFAGRLPARLSLVPDALTFWFLGNSSASTSMDNLTHTLTGVLLARAGLNRLTPRAMLIVIIAANVPDFDVVQSRGRY